LIREIQPGESITWPGNKRLALLIAIHFEADSASYIRPDGSVDTQDLTNRQYGGKIGIWRLLRILDRHEIKCTFFICGAAADRYIEAARAIAERGHDIAGHGYYHEALWRGGLHKNPWNTGKGNRSPAFGIEKLCGESYHAPYRSKDGFGMG